MPSVQLNNQALGDRNGLTEFYVYPENHSSWNSLQRRPLEDYGIKIKPAEVIRVSITTLDSYCTKNSLGCIDLLKLDLDGS
jgi:FkbM family methyltransferase